MPNATFSNCFAFIGNTYYRKKWSTWSTKTSHIVLHRKKKYSNDKHLTSRHHGVISLLLRLLCFRFCWPRDGVLMFGRKGRTHSHPSSPVFEGSGLRASCRSDPFPRPAAVIQHFATVATKSARAWMSQLTEVCIQGINKPSKTGVWMCPCDWECPNTRRQFRDTWAELN